MPDVVAWLIERDDQPEGRPLWLAWRNRARREWVTDAFLADRYGRSWEAAHIARSITANGTPCRQTEHVFVAAPVVEGD